MATMVVLAAGKGARYGKGIKQLAPIGQQGEPLMYYAIQDAMSAGFNKFIFVISREMHDEFFKAVYCRIRTLPVWVMVIYQDTPFYRVKPLGTGEAVILCREYIDEPFAVINADDYYGKQAYEKAYEYLYSNPTAERYGLIGYTLRKTLSDNGSVTRGVCEIDETGRLVRIRETKNIKAEGGTIKGLSGNEIVSMNFLLLPPSFVDVAYERIGKFFLGCNDPEQDEYLLPNILDEMIRRDEIRVDVIKTDARCYGITYESDIDKVRAEVMTRK